MRIEREIFQLRPEFAYFCPTDSAYYAMMNLLCFVTDNQLKSCLNCSKHMLKHSHKANSHFQMKIMMKICIKIGKTKGRDILVARPLLKFYLALQE